jgi:N-acetylmuramoyl-L-alanine amidase
MQVLRFFRISLFLAVACAWLAVVDVAARIEAHARSAAPLTGRVVVIDPGHNGHNFLAPQVIGRLVPAGRGRLKACNTTGTETDSGYPEAAFNWDVALRLQALLVHQGARVVLTRHSNTGVGPCVNERAAIGNQAHADAVIAIHADGGPSDGRGFQVIYAPDSGPTAATFAASLRLARVVHIALQASGVLPPSTYVGQNGYSVRDDLAGLNLSTRPAIFVELGNMRNSVDAAIQMNPTMRERLAAALDAGLVDYLTPAHRAGA